MERNIHIPKSDMFGSTILCIVCLFVSSAIAEDSTAQNLQQHTYYVSIKTGSDNNPGTSQDKPLKTIEAGIRKLRANDTLVIGPGEYYIGPKGLMIEDISNCWIVAKHLILSRPYFSRVPDQSLIAEGQGEGTHHVQATRGKDYAFIYIASGRTIKVNMGKISGKKVKAWWYDPRIGKAKSIGEKKNQGKIEFDPPGKPGKHNDWILVLDDASKKFSTPGWIK